MNKLEQFKAKSRFYAGLVLVFIDCVEMVVRDLMDRVRRKPGVKVTEVEPRSLKLDLEKGMKLPDGSIVYPLRMETKTERYIK